MNFCQKCHRPSTNEGLCNDCKKREAQLETSKIQPKKTLINLEHGNYHNYLVFQGKTFFTEVYHGIIWAPKQNSMEQAFHHWTRLKDLKVGDKIFHSVNGKIEAMSTVTKEATSSPFPEKQFDDTRYDGEGWKVCCSYVRFHKPLDLTFYRDKTKDLGQYKYSPFNKTGCGNQGYLYPLCDQLADLFENELNKFNK